MILERIKNNEICLSNQYKNMVSYISDNLPAIQKVTDNFNKSQSQFMDSMLTVSHPTPLRNARQILAEINKSREALAESYYKLKKNEIYIKKKKSELIDSQGLDKELLEVEIDELNNQCTTILKYVEGSIRKISAYITQYNNILSSIGKESFTEEDFENDEERYHIQKMFEQALCAARSHGGVVDEGNQIYAHQIGINGTVAQCEVSIYLNEESKIIESGRFPAHEMTVKWLRCMADKYSGSAASYAESKGMKLLDNKSLHAG